MPAILPIAIWAFYVFFVHTFVGQRAVARPLVAGDSLPTIARGTLEVVWHGCSWMLLLGVAALAFHALVPQPWLVRSFALQVAGLAALFLWLGPQRYGSGFALPQWIIVGPLAVALALLDAPPRISAALLLGAIALVHVAWALGITWPSPSARAMPAYVVGWPEGARGPGIGPTLAVAVVCAGFATAVWLEIAPVRWAVVVLFLGRGLFGFVERRVRPRIVKTPYALLSQLFYSPLCLFIAALAGSTR